ncbi:MAG: biotin--[acetyl-CoA-carboxylase] ligase [Micavibrio sp.]|nr:biotin--[acetyl-CoA-carboxylase] ligase [Micavibrio sp.]HCK33433.1 biotin--[acetyl-CoA-carboxylase] ligase [Rhodospirillaceae bacterium]|tara:strand:- start:319 stop:1029 length:711 start_codon:yes stop_codon:yes gene_type:complete
MVDYSNIELTVFDELESTNTYLLQKQEEEGLSSGEAVQALRQSAGRGRYDRKWEDTGGNMALSIYLEPDIAVQHLSQIAFVTAIAVVKTILAQGVPQESIRLKWPNDVLLEGKKCCGILIERAGDKGLVVGTGINVAAAPADKACILHYVSANLEDVVSAYLTSFKALYVAWQEFGFEHIVEQWMAYAWKLEEEIEVKLRHQQFKGVFKRLDKDGALIVKRSDTQEIQRITAGEIF